MLAWLRALRRVPSPTSRLLLSTVEVERECLAALPAVLEDVLSNYERTMVAHQWFSQVLGHHLPFQQLNMGFTVVESYCQLVPSAPDLPLAHTLAWCVELLGGCLAVVDDMYDGARERYGRVCWYRQQGLGAAALNDAVFLHGAAFSLLRQHASQRSYYPSLLHLFHQVGHVTHLGQVLDLHSADASGRPRWEVFTESYQRSVCRYKAEHYITCLPVHVALLMAGLEEEGLLQEVQRVLRLLGRLFQVQDDYLDAFGDPAETGKSGNDIREGRCSWVLVAALQAASPSQRASLMEHYGRADPASIAAVQLLYHELNIPQLFTAYEEELHHTIHAQIRSCPRPTQHLFLHLLAKLYQRHHSAVSAHNTEVC